MTKLKQKIVILFYWNESEIYYVDFVYFLWGTIFLNIKPGILAYFTKY